ncbi:MAG: RNA polymerase subunit sigma-70, partial [Syntrophobacteraceae bacterium CG23_combo_of_CG06-09_8_20_14_all_50_8]
MNLPAVTATLDIYIAEINRFPILTAEEEFNLALQWKKENKMEAAEKLVVSNLRFVVKIAHEYKNYRFKLVDLIQEGNIGLMHAVKKFDPYKGYRLIS